MIYKTEYLEKFLIQTDENVAFLRNNVSCCALQESFLHRHCGRTSFAVKMENLPKKSTSNTYSIVNVDV